MSNAADFAALKASIMTLYNSGAVPHVINPNSLVNIVQTGSGAQGITTPHVYYGIPVYYYTSGIVQGSSYFVDPNGKFQTTTPVLPGDLLQAPIGQFTLQHQVLNSLSDTKLTLTKPFGITVTAQQDQGYTIARQGSGSLIDTIFAQINAIQSDLGV